jgi:hypothetical protein
MFRTDDVDAMSFVFDLASYEDVREHGAEILDRLADGSMPCDARWPVENVKLFREWVDSGMPP